MENEQIWTLLARRLAGEASEGELSELQKYLSGDELFLYLQFLAPSRTAGACRIDGFSEEEAYLRLQRRLSALDPDFGEPPENGLR